MGTVAVSYYDYRFNEVNSNDGLETAHWIRRSSDGGASFGPDEILGTTFDTRKAPYAIGYFLGDYDGLASIGDVVRAVLDLDRGLDRGQAGAQRRRRHRRPNQRVLGLRSVGQGDGRDPMDHSSVDLVALNPQPLPPDAKIKLVALNPQPLPPDATIELVALNPQPLPPQATINLVALNPQPLPPRARIRLVALNPQPLPPKTTVDFVALNPQPLPPNEPLNFVAVAAWPPD